MAEIEHFVDPNDKTHSKFDTISDLKIPLYSAHNQINNESTQLVCLNDAVRTKLIDNETLAYFLGRMYLFFIQIGIDKTRIRFRQHMENEIHEQNILKFPGKLLTISRSFGKSMEESVGEE